MARHRGAAAAGQNRKPIVESLGNAKGDVSLAKPDDLKAGDYVVPGKPEESLLLDLVTATAADEPTRPRPAGFPDWS